LGGAGYRHPIVTNVGRTPPDRRTRHGTGMWSFGTKTTADPKDMRGNHPFSDILPSRQR
jgi:hypothetical protein